tara:strand:+ start:415 stop:807 length:393 start_codon:yes stop_codon:yes gene_type:complete
MDIITIYTSETCPYCKQVKEELNKANIEFNERLTKDWPVKWNEIVKLTGLGQIPTIKYGEEYFVPGRDFGNPQHLISILNNFKESNFAIDKQTFEKLKTLNHNINMAFGKLDKILREIETKLNGENEKNE